MLCDSIMAQRKRVGLITQRSEDRNLVMLEFSLLEVLLGQLVLIDSLDE
jgi:hypothetical protein